MTAMDFASRTHELFTNGLRTKDALESALMEEYGLKRDGALRVGDGFAARFSSATRSSAPNTVVAIRKVLQYDHLPVISVLVRPDAVQCRLMNTALIAKVSHSSHGLTLEVHRGSINYGDIAQSVDGIANVPAFFEQLFRLHCERDSQDELERIVANTNGIQPRLARAFSNEDRLCMRASLVLSASAYEDTEWVTAATDLAERVRAKQLEILAAAASDNAKTRGDQIEECITGEPPSHDFADYRCRLSSGELAVDIKSSRADLESSPKLANIDKLLVELARPCKVVPALFLVHIDVEQQLVRSRLVCLFDSAVTACLRVQPHWSGRNSRGTLQFSGDFVRLLSTDDHPNVDFEQACSLVDQWLS